MRSINTKYLNHTGPFRTGQAYQRYWLVIAGVWALFVCTCVEAGSMNPDPAQYSKPPLARKSSKISTTVKDVRTLSVYSTWQLQLQGRLNKNYDVTVFDVDLFDTFPAVISDLKSSGKLVICYFSAGSFENWRNDAKRFQEKDLGLALDDWPGERWLDIRSQNVRQIMASRLDLAVEKGCDGVDPDNVDGFDNRNGLKLTAGDQLDYNRFIAREAHKRKLLVGLKNDLDQIPELAGEFDFSVNEQCHEYHECAALSPFIDLGKPVFNVEYAAGYATDSTQREALCQRARSIKLRTLIMPLKLDDSFRISCD